MSWLALNLSLMFELVATGVSRLATKFLGPRGRIGYIGGHNSGNLGDEVMFEYVSQKLAPNKTETLLTPRSEEILAAIGLSGPGYFKHYLLGGGTLINEIWHGKVVRLAQMGVPMSAVGTGVGSCGKEQVATTEFQDWKDVLRGFSSVHVRGPLSQARLRAIGINASVSGDIGLVMAKSRVRSSLANRVAINVIDADCCAAALREVCTAILPRLLSRGYKIDAWVVNERDASFTELLLGEAAERIILLKDAKDVENAAADICFSICTRLHGSVFSVSHGVPTVMLGYRDKCLDFMQSIGMASCHVHLDAPDCAQLTLELVERHMSQSFLQVQSEAICKSTFRIRQELDTVFAMLR